MKCKIQTQFTVVAIIFLAFVFGGGIATSYEEKSLASAGITANGDDSKIWVALFRYMGSKHARLIHGISIDGKDPNPNIMLNFTGDAAFVKRSAIEFNSANWKVKGTGAAADVLTINTDSLKRETATRIEVEAEAHSSGRDGYIGVYTLAYINGNWVVQSYKDSGIQF